MKKPEYKKWCYKKAISLLEERDEEAEEKYIVCIESAKKKDDMGDSICQSEACYILMKSNLYDYPRPVKEEKVEKE
jgi:hypothetical protein